MHLIPLLAAAGVWLTCDNTGETPPARAVDTVVVNPPHLEVHTGDSLRFAGWGKDPSGDSVSAPLNWTATGGIILPDGRFYAPKTPGVYTVTASYGFQTVGQSTVIVRPPDSLLAGVQLEPGNLELHGGDTARLQAYAVYAVPPRMPIVPVYGGGGGAIGPDGLFTAGTDPGTFPIIAQDSSGRFADTAWVTIDGPGVASISIDPSSTTIPTDGITILTATAEDVHGDLLSGRPFLWSSSAPAIATVSSNAGVVTGVSPGQAQISAMNGSVTGAANVTVTGPNNGPWPNEPVGFNLISDQPWTLLTSLNWTVEFGAGLVGVDASAPFSPPGVLVMTYPIGFTAGEAPATLIHDLGNVKQLYVGMWWKVSNPWQGHPSNVNKIAFMFPASAGDMYIAFYGEPGGPYELRTVTQFPGIDGPWLTPNVKNVPVTLGVWHRIEWLLVYNTSNSPPNGISRWWMDGQLIGDWRNVQFPNDAGMQTFKLSPTWGGVGGAKSELDFYWYDHTRLSGK